MELHVDKLATKLWTILRDEKVIVSIDILGYKIDQIDRAIKNYHIDESVY